MREEQRELGGETGSSQRVLQCQAQGAGIPRPLSPLGHQKWRLCPLPTWSDPRRAATLGALVPAALPSAYLPPTEKSDTA